MRVVAVVLGVLCLCGTAQAQVVTFDVRPDITHWKAVRQNLERASRHWDSRPCPNVSVGVMRSLEYKGWALIPGCRMWVSESALPLFKRWPIYMCNVIVHEYGHMLGHDHDYAVVDPIMAHPFRTTARECRRAR